MAERLTTDTPPAPAPVARAFAGALEACSGQDRGGRAWRLRPDLVGRPADPAAVARAAAALSATYPDDLVAAAAAAGATANPAFREILDGGDFTAAVCLCCHVATTAAAARRADAALSEYRRRYDAAAYLGSRAFTRAAAALARDLDAAELAAARRQVAAAPATRDVVRAANAATRVALCVAEPPCRPGTLWVYSTPDGRRLLRHFARHVGAVRVTVASSEAGVWPRAAGRMYAAAFVPGRRRPAGAATLADAALAWVREQK
jgi:hypothetical protein